MFGTVLKIAWRNIWRNQLRSSIVIVSMILGIWSGMFIMALTFGLNEQRMNGAINTYLSHIQIHNTTFLDNYDKNDTLLGSRELLAQLGSIPHIKAVSQRIILQGMASTARGNYGVQINGIFPDKEQRATDVAQKLVAGTYFKKFKSNPVVIGAKLADKLGIGIRSKLILNFQDSENNTLAVGFRVEGIFKTINSVFDESNVFVRYGDIAQLAGLEGQIHEIAIVCDNISDTEGVESQINTPNTVESWDVISPELGYAQETLSNLVYIFMGIILLALAFGIINTMLMAILERRRELGMLLSVGMNKRKVFGMILLETVLLAILATPLGLLSSYWSIQYFGSKGIDLSIVSAGLESLGIGARIFTYLPYGMYFEITLMTLITALLSALIPAYRALRIRPAEAVKIM